ncbi:uncharacterized protein TNCV_4739901 [Trichonephila clavipes]|nr:uncharacterized protein TNCV_4739901 [Trichonephila clavipes]
MKPVLPCDISIRDPSTDPFGKSLGYEFGLFTTNPLEEENHDMQIKLLYIVLIGDRPVSRTVDREHRKISSICRETTPIMKHESQEDFLERSNAVEITIRKCKIPPPEPEKQPKEEIKPSETKFTCRNCGGGDRGRVAIYRPFGEVSLSLNHTVTCMVLKANDRRTSCPCHDEFRGPRSDYVRQVAQKAPIKTPAPKKEVPEKPAEIKDSEELRKTSSEEKPSPEESSEVSGMKSPSKRDRVSRGKACETLESSSAKSSSESSRHAGRLSQPDWISSSAEGGRCTLNLWRLNVSFLDGVRLLEKGGSNSHVPCSSLDRGSKFRGSCSCQDYGSFEDSQTVTTDDGSLNPEIKQALESAERRRQEYLDKVEGVDGLQFVGQAYPTHALLDSSPVSMLANPYG